MLKLTHLLAVTACLAASPALAQEKPAAAEDTAAPERPAQLSDESMDNLFESLAVADSREAARIENEILDRWSSSGSDSIDLLVLRGRRALDKRDFKKAIAHFSRAIAFDPKHVSGWNGRATAYFADRQLGRSLADLYEVLRLEPRHFGAMIGLGLIFEALDQDAEASAAYEEAQRLHPHIEGAKDGLERLRKSVKGEEV